MHNATIRIPQPCLESWADMTPAKGGRHCAACQKTVVDFSQKADAEILAYFRRAGEGSTCGRFRTTQVGKPLAVHAARPPRYWQPWLAGVLAAVLALQACDPASRVAPRPPLAYTSQLPAFDSVAVLPSKQLPDDSTLAAAAPDSLSNNYVLGYTITPESSAK